MEAGLFMPVLLAWARLQSKTLGHKKCRESGVGGLIRELRAEIPENGAGQYVASARENVMILESVCRRCGRCKEMRTG